MLSRYSRIRELASGDIYEVMQIGHNRDEIEPLPGGEVSLVRIIYKVRSLKDGSLREVKDVEIGEGKTYEVV